MELDEEEEDTSFDEILQLHLDELRCKLVECHAREVRHASGKRPAKPKAKPKPALAGRLPPIFPQVSFKPTEKPDVGCLVSLGEEVLPFPSLMFPSVTEALHDSEDDTNSPATCASPIRVAFPSEQQVQLSPQDLQQQLHQRLQQEQQQMQMQKSSSGTGSGEEPREASAALSSRRVTGSHNALYRSSTTSAVTPVMSHRRTRNSNESKRDYVPRDAWLLRNGVPSTLAVPKTYTSGSKRKNRRRVMTSSSIESGLAIGKWVILPGSDIRFVWAIMTVVVVTCDLLTLPMRVCFKLDKSGVMHALDVVTLVFWMADILVSFGTAIHVRNKLLSSLGLVALHYMRSFFLTDLVLCLLDFGLLWADMSVWDDLPPDMQTAVRWLRFVRCARLVKVKRVLLRPILDHFLFEGTLRTITMDIYASLMGINIFACCWYVVGRTDGGWTTQGDVESWAFWRKYTYSLHWSVGRLQGTSYVVPGNTLESTMAVWSDLVCFFGSAVFISHLVRMVSATRSGNQAEKMRRIAVNYLQMHAIPPHLQRRVKQWLRSYHQRDALHETRQLMGQLPENLLGDLLHEARGTVLCKMQLFIEFEAISVQAFRMVCHKAVSEALAMDGEVVFDIDVACTQMILVANGRLAYQLEAEDEELLDYNIAKRFASGGSNTTIGSTTDTITFGFFPSQVVVKGSHLAEPVLWTPWSYAGKLQSIGRSAVLGLHPEPFGEVLDDFPEAKTHASLYCRLFVRRLNAACQASVHERSDIMCFYDNFDDIYAQADGSDDHFIFLSHYKEEAGTEATLMLENLERMVSRELPHISNDLITPVFLDSENLRDLNLLKEHVKRSYNLVLLLTPGVLSRPWCLYEIVLAFRNGTQIIPVQVKRPGHKFRLPEDSYYDKLLRGEQLPPEAEELLNGEGVSLIDVHEALRYTFSQIVVEFSPHSPGAIRQAQLAGILKCCVYVDEHGLTAANSRMHIGSIGQTGTQSYSQSHSQSQSATSHRDSSSSERVASPVPEQSLSPAPSGSKVY